MGLHFEALYSWVLHDKVKETILHGWHRQITEHVCSLLLEKNGWGGQPRLKSTRIRSLWEWKLSFSNPILASTNCLHSAVCFACLPFLKNDKIAKQCDYQSLALQPHQCQKNIKNIPRLFPSFFVLLTLLLVTFFLWRRTSVPIFFSIFFLKSQQQHEQVVFRLSSQKLKFKTPISHFSAVLRTSRNFSSSCKMWQATSVGPTQGTHYGNFRNS